MTNTYDTRCRGVLRGVQFGWTDFNGTRYQQLIGRFELLDGVDVGKYDTWFASLSDDVSKKGRSFYEYTVDSLRYCGWDGNDLAALPVLAESGQLANEVELSRYHKLDQESGKWRTTIRYVNRLGDVHIDLGKNAMSNAEIADFAKKMQSRISALPKGSRHTGGTAVPSRGAAPPAPRRDYEPPPDYRDGPPPGNDDIPF